MKEDFFWMVYGALEEIPKGKVTTYSDLAKMIGKPKNARLVGTALKHAGYYGDFPCQRVVHNDGSLAPYFDEQYDLLIEEGITFIKGKVDMKKHRYQFNSEDRSMVKKYIFFDIDGTLTDDNPGGRIHQSTIDTLRKLEANGHFVAIATGRSYTLVQQFMEITSIKNLVCNGGNAIIIDNVLQYNHPLEREKALIILKECIQKNIPFCFAKDDSNDKYALDDRFKALMPGNYNTFYIDPNYQLDDFDTFYKLFIGLDKDHEDQLESLGLLGYARYFASWLIIEPDDKYKGICDIVKRMNGNLEDIVVFGDGYNDVSMMEKAPMSIAMGNAIPKLKEIATYITLDNKHDGVTFACKHFGWID